MIIKDTYATYQTCPWSGGPVSASLTQCFISANEFLTGITVITCFVQGLIKVTSDTKYRSLKFFGLN